MSNTAQNQHQDQAYSKTGLRLTYFEEIVEGRRVQLVEVLAVNPYGIIRG